MKNVHLIFVVMMFGACADLGRRGAFSPAKVNRVTIDTAGGPVTSEEKEGSWFSIGALIGDGVPVYKTDKYKVINNVVMLDRKGKFVDYLSPAVYALPSVSIWGHQGQSLSLILPITGSAKDNLSAGFGLSYGFSIRGGYEIGFGASLVIVQVPQLNDQQQQSFNNQTPLPADTDSNISTSSAPVLAIGLYVLPVLK